MLSLIPSTNLNGAIFSKCSKTVVVYDCKLNTSLSLSLMHPKDISIQDFSYNLPDERIARYPLEDRDASKLLIYRKGVISEDVYANIEDHIPAHSVLVFNNTKVVHARLVFQNENGARIEVFCLEPADGRDPVQAMMMKGQSLWKCMVGHARKWKEDKLKMHFELHRREVTLTAEQLYHEKDHFLIKLKWSPDDMSFAEILHEAGKLPIPPYLKRDAEESDENRYQTVFAEKEGSVAAPTAALHFTNELLERLRSKGHKTSYLTLHVGAGTFKPVKSPTMETHDMHSELIDVSIQVLQDLKEDAGRLIAVGTTSLRTLESLYWIGLKLRHFPDTDPESISLTQWEPYEFMDFPSPAESLEILVNYLMEHKLTRLLAHTQLLIAPGYQFRMVKAIVTNFHQPQSTLLLLVAAAIGEDWKKVYDYALKNDFRFLSYGDGSILYINQPD